MANIIEGIVQMPHEYEYYVRIEQVEEPPMIDAMVKLGFSTNDITQEQIDQAIDEWILKEKHQFDMKIGIYKTQSAS